MLIIHTNIKKKLLLSREIRTFYFYLLIKPSAHLEATQFSGSRKGNQAP